MFQLWGGPFFLFRFTFFASITVVHFFDIFPFLFSLSTATVAFLIQTHATYSEPAPTYLAAPQVDVQQKKKKNPPIASGCRRSLLHKGSLICNKQRGVQFAVDSHGER